MIYKKKIKYIFLLSHDNQKPFNNLSLFDDNYIVAVLPYYRFSRYSSSIVETSQIILNRKKINSNYKKIYFFFEPLGILLFHFYQFLFLIKFLIKNKKILNEKVAVISTGNKNYLYSLAVKLLCIKVILVNYPMDRIYEKANYFHKNIFQKFLNTALIKIQNLIRINSLKYAQMIYESNRLYNYEKDKYKCIKYKPIIFNYKHCDYENFLSNVKKKIITKNVMFFGNLFLDDNHFSTLLNVQNIIKKKYNIQLKLYVVGGDDYVINYLNKKNKFVKFYGYVQDFKKVKKIFKNCIFGSALYDFNNIKKSRLTSSGKIQNYIQHGLLVLASGNVFEKKIINHHKLGIATNDINEIVKFIVEILKKRKYSEYSIHLKRFVKENDDKVHLKKLYRDIINLI